MTTKKELTEILQAMKDYPDDCQVVIYPKYSYHKVDGYKKHSFIKENVCKMESLDQGRYIAIIF